MIAKRARKTVPGNSSYASVTQNGNKVGLLGDSNFNKIMVNEMSGLVVNGNVTKYSYSGATSVHLGHYCDILLNDQPDAVIIHCGTNDIHGRNKRNVSVETIAHNIIDIGRKCKSRGVNTIYISSIISTRNIGSNMKAVDINNLLKVLCDENHFIYICNDFLVVDDLQQNDPVHLSWDGRRKLVTNYISILNN